MACMDFSDFEPALEPPIFRQPFQCPYFSVSMVEVQGSLLLPRQGGAILLVVEGSLRVRGEGTQDILRTGDSFLYPVSGPDLAFLSGDGVARLIRVDLP